MLGFAPRVSSSFFRNLDLVREGGVNCPMWEMASDTGTSRGAPVLIGLSGKAGSGKDTVGDYLVEMFDFRKLSFAEPLKKGASVLFDIPEETLHSREKKEEVDPRYGRSPRELLQWLGTDVLRNQIDEKFFLNHMSGRLDKILLEKGHQVVITDVRFDNEAELVRSYGGQVWKLDASVRLPTSCLSGETKHHVSEEGPKFSPANDKVLDNNGTKAALIRKVDSLLSGIPEMNL